MKDDKNLQAKHSTLLKKQKHLLNEKLIFTHYFNRVYDEECRKSFNFEEYFKNRMSREREIGTLDINQKYDVVHSELQNAHTKQETFEKRKDEQTELLH